MVIKGIIAAIGLVVLSSQSALAQCVWDPNPPADIGSGTAPTTLTIPSYTFYIDADAQVDTNKPINKVMSDKQPMRISYHNCDGNENYGKSILPPLTPRGIRQELFETSIPGIKVRPLWNNASGSASGKFESVSTIPVSIQKRFDYPANSYFELEFVKTANHLSLTNPAGDLVLPSGIIAYNWLNSDSPTNFGQRLLIGEIRVISTPVCRINAPNEVDFNTVTVNNLSQGVRRPLNFSINCATDYNTYSVQARLNAKLTTQDGFIRVTDKAGHTDRMKIRIDNAVGRQLAVDGSDGQSIINLASNVSANFNWQATLLPGSSSEHPENGAFSATAEIVLVVN